MWAAALPFVRLPYHATGLIYLVSVVALFLIVPSSAPAQIQIVTVRGTVTDPVGALLSGASVMLSNPITGYRNVATTDQSGEFVFNNVPFGPYNLHVQSPGFQIGVHDVSVRSNIPVAVAVKLLTVAFES